MQQTRMEKKNYGKKFFSDVAVLAVSTFIVKLIGMIYKIPMMAYLGAEGMGYYNSAYEIYSIFFVISTTGLPVAVSILVSENQTKGHIKNVNKIFRVSMVLIGIIGLVGTLFMGILHGRLANLINNDPASYCILAISPTLFMICLTGVIRGYFQGHQIMKPTAISQIIEALGKLLLGLLFATVAIKKGYPTPQVAAFAVLGVTLGVAVSLLYLTLCKLIKKSEKSSGAELLQADSSRSISKSLLTIAIPITLSSLILSLTKLIDMSMILIRLGDISYTQAQANAIYGAYSTMAVSIYNLPSTLIATIALPLVPTLTSTIEQKDTAAQKSIIKTAMKLTGLIAIPASLGIAVFSKPILTLLFSSQTAEIEYTAPLLSILALSVFLSSMITTTNAILQAYKLVKKPIISMAFGTAVKLAMAFWLIGIPQINIYGAPISTFFSTLVIVSLNMYFIIKEIGSFSSVFSLFGRSFIAALISMAAGIGLFALLGSAVSTSISVLIAIATVVLLYAILSLKLKAIEREEILMLPRGEAILQMLTKTHII